MGKFVDLTNQRFGKLVVKYRITKDDKKVWWFCQCDCGNSAEVISYNLTHHLCQSCGCLRKEVFNVNHQPGINSYDLTHEFGIGYTLNNKSFRFDLEDYEKIKQHYWQINTYGEVFTYLRNTEKPKKSLFIG